MRWGEEAKKQEAETRKKLQAKGIQLLEMIRKEVARKTSEEVNANPGRVQIEKQIDGRELEKLPPILRVGGSDVDLKIYQHSSSGVGMMGSYFHDRLTVKVDWIWIDGHIYQKTKSFAHSSKMRQETFGFDVPKIAEYIIWWVGEKRRILEELKEKKKTTEKAEDAKKQWQSSANRILSSFKLPPASTVEATPSGLKFTIVTDERHLEAILRALIHEEK